MSSIDTALVLTALSAEVSEAHTRAERNSSRIRQALALDIGGVFVCERQTVLYRLEGEAEDIDRLLSLFPSRFGESVLVLIDRWAIPRRVALRRRLHEAVLIDGEHEWMRRQLAVPRVDTRLMRLFTLWLDLRTAERNMGLVLDFTAASLDRFPGSSSN